MAEWVEGTVGVSVPAERITAAEYRAGRPGFVGHGELDPGRRSDPGSAFPWDEFLELFAAETQPAPPPPSDRSMFFHEAMDDVDELYRAYRNARPSLSERSQLGREIAEGMFTRGEDPRVFLARLEFMLRQETTRSG